MLHVRMRTAVYHSRTTDGVFTVAGDVESSQAVFLNATKEVFVRDVAFGLQPVVVPEQTHESAQVVVGSHFRGDGIARNGRVESFLQSVADAFLWRVRMQRVVNVDPFDGEVAVLPESLIPEHLLRQVAHLNIEHPPAQPLGNCLQHHGKQLRFLRVLLLLTVGVLYREHPFAHHPAMHIEIGRKP